MEFSTEAWPSHRKGTNTRDRILALLSKDKGMSVVTIANQLGITERAVRKHIQTLISEGQIYRGEDKLIFLTSNYKYLPFSLINFITDGVEQWS